MTATPTKKPSHATHVSDRARTLRPAYFDRLDTLLASGAFAIEDDRKTHPPTGRRYAD